MKRLTLVRHAKSSWKDPELTDFDRPLNKRGKQDAPLMGERLAALEQRPELLVSSPAKRASKTARLIARELKIPDEQLIFKPEIYEAEPDALLEVVRGLDDRWEHVLLVGHNPGLTDLGNLLADCGIENIPTCGVLCLDFDAEGWQSLGPKSGILVFYDYPKKPAN
jgi:phosphohistidine phosphatase